MFIKIRGGRVMLNCIEKCIRWDKDIDNNRFDFVVCF